MRNTWLTFFASLLFLSLSLTAQAADMDGATMKQHLNEVLGDSSSWAVAVLGHLKKGMSFEEVKAVFPQASEIDAAKKVSKSTVEGLDNPILKNYELKFREGKLYGALVHFKRNLDKEVFKQVSLEVFENKFGKVKPEKRDKDIINKFNSDGQGAQRAWLVDHWLLEVDIP